MVFLAIINETICEKTYGRHMSDLSGHQLSTLTGIITLGAYSWIFTGLFRIESSKQALLIGIMWLLMTRGDRTNNTLQPSIGGRVDTT